MTRCLSAISVHLAHTQSLHLQYRLCPLSAETTPWLRQRAHFGVRWYRSVARRKNAGGMAPSTGCWDIKAETSIPLGRLMLQGCLAATHAGLLSNMQNCWVICRNVELCAEMLNYEQNCWVMSRNVELCAESLSYVQNCWVMSRTVEVCAEMLSYVQNRWVICRTFELVAEFLRWIHKSSSVFSCFVKFGVELLTYLTTELV